MRRIFAFSLFFIALCSGLVFFLIVSPTVAYADELCVDKLTDITPEVAAVIEEAWCVLLEGEEHDAHSCECRDNSPSSSVSDFSVSGVPAKGYNYYYHKVCDANISCKGLFINTSVDSYKLHCSCSSEPIFSSDIEKVVPRSTLLGFFGTKDSGEAYSGLVGKLDLRNPRDPPPPNIVVGSVQGNYIFKNPLKYECFEELLFALIDGITIILMPLIVLSIAYIGFRMVWAGHEKNVDYTKWKNAFAMSLVGLFLVLGARGILFVIQNTVKDVLGPEHAGSATVLDSDSDLCN